MRKFIFCLTLLSLSFISCEKLLLVNDQQNMLTRDYWTPAITDQNPASNPAGNVHYYYPSYCETQDIYQFDNNNQLTINYAQGDCAIYGTPQVGVFVYNANYDANTIIINGVVYILAEISEHQLKYYTSTSSDSNTSSYEVYLFER